MDLHSLFKKTTETGKETIRGAFRKKLLLLVICAFAVTFSIAYYMQTLQAEERAHTFLADQLTFLCDQVQGNRGSSSYLKANLDDSLVNRAKAIAHFLELDPSLADNSARLGELCKNYNLKGIYIADEAGNIVGSYPASFKGSFNFKDSLTTVKYMELLRNKEMVISEEPRMSADKRADYMKFIGVARKDKPGFIQIALDAEEYLKYMDKVSLGALVRGYTVGETGSVYIFNKTGTVEGATNPKVIGLNLEQLGLNKNDYEQPNGFFKATPLDDKPSLCAFDKHDAYMIVATYPNDEIYAKRNDLLVWNGVLYFLLFVAVYVLVSMLLENSVVKNIFTVNKSLSDITNGNLEEKVDVRDYQEFSMLSSGINSTVDALKKAIAEAAARLDRELEIARIIQSSSLPTKFPPWPEIKAFDIFASMRMATQVGGDFYDFFLIGDKLGFVMADVSGHGIPAALFMMTARTQIKNHMQEDGDLGEEFARINNQLCANNEAMMFVTVFAGILDYKTGLLTCVNAGHNKPFIKQNGGIFTMLKNRSGLVMGSMENMRYKPFTVQLSHGDELCVYTDGITEATNKADEQFGNDRLQITLNNAGTDDVKQLAQNVQQAVDKFADGQEQADDQTILLWKWN
jgi:hypothetical protein